MFGRTFTHSLPSGLTIYHRLTFVFSLAQMQYFRHSIPQMSKISTIITSRVISRGNRIGPPVFVCLCVSVCLFPFVLEPGLSVEVMLVPMLYILGCRRCIGTGVFSLAMESESNSSLGEMITGLSAFCCLYENRP